MRVALLSVVAGDLCLIAARVFSYGALLNMPGGPGFVVEPVLLLIVYGVLVVWATSKANPFRERILHYGTWPGVAGYRASGNGTVIGGGAVVGSWSAVVTMVMAVTLGFVLMFSSIPPLEYVATWPEFKSSGWGDVRVFSIANTLESGFSHLLVGPVIGAVFGGIASVIALVRRGGQPRLA